MYASFTLSISGSIIDQNESREQQLYNATHHLLVASAWAVKIGHEIDPTNKIGNMFAGGTWYPYTCHPQDILQQLQKIGMHSFFVMYRREVIILRIN